MNHMRYKRELVQIIEEQDHMIDPEAQDQNQPSDNPYKIEPTYFYLFSIHQNCNYTELLIEENYK